MEKTVVYRIPREPNPRFEEGVVTLYIGHRFYSEYGEDRIVEMFVREHVSYEEAFEKVNRSDIEWSVFFVYHDNIPDIFKLFLKYRKAYRDGGDCDDIVYEIERLEVEFNEHGRTAVGDLEID